MVAMIIKHETHRVAAYVGSLLGKGAKVFAASLLFWIALRIVCG